MIKKYATNILVITLALIGLMYFLYSTSPWAALEKHYKSELLTTYEDNTYEIRLIEADNNKKKAFYYVKFALTNSGFFFSRPIEYHIFGGYNQNGNIIIFHRPLYIPWSSIKMCKKNEYPNFNKMEIQLVDTDTSIEIALWDFLKPECEKRGIPLHEN